MKAIRYLFKLFLVVLFFSATLYGMNEKEKPIGSIYDEHNNNKYNADEITIGNAVIGQLGRRIELDWNDNQVNQADKTDYFTFDADSNKIITFKFTTNYSSKITSVTFFKNQSIFKTLNINSSTTQYSFDVKEDATYYIKITGTGNKNKNYTYSFTTSAKSNTPPTISTSSFPIAENSTSNLMVNATDADGDNLTYSISGGVDSSKFNINSSTGALTFKTAPDYENPTDNGGDNIYNITIAVSDGSENVTKDITITVTDVADTHPPVISGGNSVNLSKVENQTAVTTIVATDEENDDITYRISGGEDRNNFNLNSSTGELIFAITPDYENPTDVGQDNSYEVEVKANDGDEDSEAQTIIVNITDNTGETTPNGICVTADDVLQTFESTIRFQSLASVVNLDSTLPSSNIIDQNSQVHKVKCAGVLCEKEALVPPLELAEIKTPDEISSSFNFGSETRNLNSNKAETINKLSSLRVQNGTRYTINVGDNNSGNLAIETINGENASNILISKNSTYNLIIKNLTTTNANKFSADNVIFFKADNIRLNGNTQFLLQADRIDVNNFIVDANAKFEITTTTPNQDVEVRVNRMEFKANDTIYLPSGNYYFNTLKFSANINIKIVGDRPVRFFVNNLESSGTANMTINGNTQDPSKFLLYINNGGYLSAENGTLYGLVASRGEYSLSENYKIVGAVIARSIILKNIAKAIYDDRVKSDSLLGEHITFCLPDPSACSTNDLCYKSIDTEGMCFFFNMFCKVTTTVKNNSGVNLGNVIISKTFQGMNFSMGDSIGIAGVKKTLVADSDEAEQSSNFSFPAGINAFKSGAVYRLGDFTTTTEENYYDKTTFGFDMSKVLQIAQYRKGDSDCTIQLESCSDINITYDYPNIATCGIFPSALSTWKDISTGSSNNRAVRYTDKIYADSINNDIRCYLNGESGSNANCEVEELTIAKMTFPTFLPSNYTVDSTITQNTTLTDENIGDITINNANVTFKASTSYNNGSQKYMKINSIAGTDSPNKTSPVTLTFEAGDYWIGSWTTGKALKVRTNGKVRFFINGDMTLNQNFLDFNYDSGNGLAGNLYIFVNGDFDATISDGGNEYKLTAYVYVKGEMNIGANPDHFLFKGAFTAEDDITTHNNQKYEYNSESLTDDGFGECGNTYSCNWREFTPRKIKNIKGNVKVIGNTVQCVTDSQTGFDGNCSNDLTYNNNQYYTKYIDIDNEDITFNSSGANLRLSPTAKILWAGLYWQGKLYKKNGEFIKWRKNLYPPNSLESLDKNDYNTNEVKFRPAGRTEYVTVKAQQSDCYNGEDKGELYSNFADVTHLISPSYYNGLYTVANLQSTYGKENVLGNFGAWTLVVVYEDRKNANESLRNISVFDGYKIVSTQVANASEVVVNVSGFLTPRDGDINSSLSIFASEGEFGDSYKDSLKIGTHYLGNANDAFNSSLSGINTVPSLINTNGIDIDTYDVSSFMANEQTSASIKLRSMGDTYFPSVIVFATELYEPKICYLQEILNANGNPITSSVNQYSTLQIKTLIANKDRNSSNTSNANSAQQVKVNVEIDNEDIRYSQHTNGNYRETLGIKDIGQNSFVSKTNLEGDDTASFISETNTTKFNIGTGANSSTGGTINPGDEVYLKFDIDTLKEDGMVIDNYYTVSYYDNTMEKLLTDMPIAECAEMNTSINVRNQDDSLCYIDVTTDTDCEANTLAANTNDSLAYIGSGCEVTWALINKSEYELKNVVATKSYATSNGVGFNYSFTSSCGVNGVMGNCSNNMSFLGSSVSTDYSSFIGGVSFNLPNMLSGATHSIYTINNITASSGITAIKLFIEYQKNNAAFLVNVGKCDINSSLDNQGQFRVFDKGRYSIYHKKSGDINTHIVNKPFSLEFLALNQTFSQAKQYTGVIKAQMLTKSSSVAQYESLANGSYDKYIEFNDSKIEDINYTFDNSYKDLRIRLKALLDEEGNLVNWSDCQKEVWSEFTTVNISVENYNSKSAYADAYANAFIAIYQNKYANVSANLKVAVKDKARNYALAIYDGLKAQAQNNTSSSSLFGNIGSAVASLNGGSSIAIVGGGNNDEDENDNNDNPTQFVDLNNSNSYNRCLKKMGIMHKCMTICASNEVEYMTSDDCYSCIFSNIIDTDEDNNPNNDNQDLVLTSYSDNFAIRPDRFEMTISKNNSVLPTNSLLFAGDNFDLDFRVKDVNDTIITTYLAEDVNNTTNDVNYKFTLNYVDLKDSNGCIKGELSNIQDKAFVEGLLNIADTDYSEVGDINITIQEPITGDCTAIKDASSVPNVPCYYAITDHLDRNISSDTESSISDEQKYITPMSQVLRFQMHHFEVNTNLYDTINNFTFLAGHEFLDRQHGNLDVNITSRNYDGNITKNYRVGCYATGTGTVSLNYALETVDDNLSDYYLGLLEKFNYQYTYANNQSCSDCNGSTVITTGSDNMSFQIAQDVFVDGVADLDVKFNFERKKDSPIIPFKLNVSALTYTDTTYPNVETNSTQPTGDVTFYYGRLYSPSRIGESPIRVVVDYEVYMPSGLSQDIARITNRLSADSINWYNIGINQTDLVPMGASNGFDKLGLSEITSSSPFIEASISFTGAKPYKDTIRIMADEWLLYNKYNSDVTSNDFTLEFIDGKEGWSGVGEEAKTTVDGNVSKRTTRRLDW